MKTVRIWLLVVLAVMLPVRGAVAAAMLCMPSSATGQRAVATEDHRKRRLAKGQAGGRPPGCDKANYAHRNVVERCILRLQWFRRIAVRYDKRAENYRAFVTIAAIILWLR